MLSVLLILVTLQNLVAAQDNIISVPNGDTRGNWGTMEVCDEGTVARGFQLKVDRYRSWFTDATALNGITLYCGRKLSWERVKIIRSSVGVFGKWGSTLWCNKGYLKSFSLRVASGDVRDKTAANNIKFLCSDGSVIGGDGLSQGTYGPWSTNCETGIHGIQARVQEKQGYWKDDVALTDVKFLCRNT